MKKNKLMWHEPTIYFDVDETLIIHPPKGQEFKTKRGTIELKGYGRSFHLKPHRKHIAELKKRKKEGFVIVVWTASGAPWGREIIKKLKLTKYVDFIVSKPEFYYDDKKQIEFMHEQKRLYFKQK